MDKFVIIYRILKILEKAMETEKLDIRYISAEKLKISETLWNNIIVLLAENEYVKGVLITECVDGFSIDVNIENIKITLKGLEYLNENTFMKRAARIFSGVREIKGIVD